MNIFTAIYVLLLSQIAFGARILGIFPMNSFSHYILAHTLLEEMTKRGHEVVLITPYTQNKEIRNYKEIYLKGLIEKVDECKTEFIQFSSSNPVSQTVSFHDMGLVLTEYTLEYPDVQKLIHSNEKFDLIFMDQFMNEGLLGLVHKFKAPLVFSSSMGASSWCNHIVGNPAPMSYVPNLNAGYISDMTFWERVNNVYISIAEELYKRFVNFPAHNRLLQKHFPGSPSIEEIMYNASFVLANSHVSTNNPVPHVPNMVEIGGFHVKRGVLSKEIQDFLDSATHGAIYMALGSNVKSSDLSLEKRQIIMNVFASLKQKILWKFETDLPDKPDNVMIRKWFPQQSILGHPNTKVFISHGGLVGSIEAVYFGVPVLGVPLFADQKMNIRLASLRGYAVAVPYPEWTDERLKWGLNELLNNPKYRENIKERSKIMNDRVVNPLDEAVYWLEYVIRHKGAFHLRNGSMKLNWFQHHLFDVVLFYISALTAIILGVYVILNKIYCLIFSHNKFDKNVTNGKQILKKKN